LMSVILTYFEYLGFSYPITYQNLTRSKEVRRGWDEVGTLLSQ